ncbi:MAG: tripartite tricarboxylate transporter substrate binding protein, partial [Limnohabitans sp.]|nr:tripartite tricarboxylate transporter substrate binding protein [Limnohabitans sp.]
MLKRHLNQITVALALAATLPLSFAQSAAPSWPSKPIKLIVPYAAGGPADVVARELALVLTADLKQPVTVENQGGGMGVPALGVVARAE